MMPIPTTNTTAKETGMLDLAANAAVSPAAAVPPAIAAAAAFVASATARLDAANAVLTEAVAAAERVHARITTLETERQAIAARRARGEHQDHDGARLELIRLDLEGLAAIAAEADAEAADRRQRTEAEQRILATARGQLSHAEDAAALEALQQHAGQLDTLLENAIRRMTDIAARTGARLTYVPSPALASSFRRLLAAAGRL